jgi:hypothetical protein
MSGMIVDALDQVRITCLDGLFLATSTFLASFSCTYGPFFTDLDILFSLISVPSFRRRPEPQYVTSLATPLDSRLRGNDRGRKTTAGISAER